MFIIIVESFRVSLQRKTYVTDTLSKE